MERIETIAEIVRNVRLFDAYGRSNRADQRAFFEERLRLGKIFVYLTQGKETLFCPSRFAGYKDNTMSRHIAFEDKSGSVTTPRITSVIGSRHDIHEQAEANYLALCSRVKVDPSGKTRTYWALTASSPKAPVQNPEQDSDSGFPDEVNASTTYAEGASKTVTVNAYERHPEARKKCIEHHGSKCVVCNFDFHKAYGEIGRNFIHVHHLKPIALRDGEYQVDPIKDLVPVCPNCHAMLHKSDPPFSIAELRELRRR